MYLEEYNLLGTGVSVGIGRSSNVDRSGTGFFLTDDRLLGSHLALKYASDRNSDGRSEALSLVRPFYSLDTRWSAGASGSKDSRIVSVYEAGTIQRRYRSESSNASVFGGWSAGLVDGRVQRYSVGLSRQDKRSSSDLDPATPERWVEEDKLIGPFLRYERLEDNFEKLSNRNLLERPEYFLLGFASTLQVDRSEPRLGANRAGWMYSGRISHGFELAGRKMLMASASLSGGRLDGRTQPLSLGTQLSYHLPQSQRWLFYAAASYDRLSHAGANDALVLGGDNGLRGYPLRYQSGRRRALFTLEERFYTDWFIWRLFRIGGAMFVDTGRAWGDAAANQANPGWLSDAGVGLRIMSARSAFGNVLHLDVAYALNPGPDIRKIQFLVKSKTTF